MIHSWQLALISYDREEARAGPKPVSILHRKATLVNRIVDSRPDCVSFHRLLRVTSHDEPPDWDTIRQRRMARPFDISFVRETDNLVCLLQLRLLGRGSRIEQGTFSQALREGSKHAVPSDRACCICLVLRDFL